MAKSKDSKPNAPTQSPDRVNRRCGFVECHATNHGHGTLVKHYETDGSEEYVWYCNPLHAVWQMLLEAKDSCGGDEELFVANTIEILTEGDPQNQPAEQDSTEASEVFSELAQIAAHIFESPEYNSELSAEMEALALSKLQSLHGEIREFAFSMLTAFAVQKRRELSEKLQRVDEELQRIDTSDQNDTRQLSQEDIDAEVFDLLRPEYRKEFPDEFPAN